MRISDWSSDVCSSDLGTVYILVATDSGNRIDEWPNDTVQSNIVAHEIHVDPIPFADLVVDSVVAPAQAIEGNQVTVRYSVTNRGAGDTDHARWADQNWLQHSKNRPNPGPGTIFPTTLSYHGAALAT